MHCPRVVVDPPSPQRFPDCSSKFCYHCVVETTTRLISAVERSLEKVDAVASSTKNHGFQRQPSFTPSHRRCRSDDALVVASDNRTFNRKVRHFPSNSSSTSSRFADLNKSAAERTIKECLKQAEQLKRFIAQREYETNLELERENAHFVLSELLISSIEQMKWRNVMSANDHYFYGARTLPTRRQDGRRYGGRDSSASTSSGDDSSPKGNSDQEVSFDALCNANAANDFSENGRRAAGVDSLSGSYSDNYGISSTSQTSDDRATDVGYSTATLTASSVPESQIQPNSAELVALNLLEKFSKKHFPNVNDMPWMVSYKDAPQLLLPMPCSRAVAPDDLYVESGEEKVNIRGTFEWAPPRPQLIFNLHTPQKLKVLLANQGNKCPGCGRKIEPGYYKRLRYCAYSGKAFCQCCHKGETSLIPAHILYRWSFVRYPVSDFFHRFLTSNYESPYYNVDDINPRLYCVAKALRRSRDKRRRLIFAYDYIRTCRLAKDVFTKDGNLLDLFNRLPVHYFQNVDLYSIKDFVLIKDGAFERLFESAVNWAKVHIEACEFCRAKGFYCEICPKKDLLFPFQTDTIRRCEVCGCLFHKSCVRKKFDCLRCRRIRSRKETVIESEET